MPDGSDFSLVFSRALGKVVQVHGELDSGLCSDAEDRLLDVIDGQGNRQVVLDLRGATGIDFAGLLVLVDALKRMDEYGGELLLGGPTSFVAEQLRAAGVDEVFLVTPAWTHPARGRFRRQRERTAPQCPLS
jgi:anti-anti-sigma factor